MSAGSDVAGKWHFWIDRGGTFTDVVARAPGRQRRWRARCSRTTPAPTTMPRSKASACCLGLASGAPIPAERIATVKMGTTVATNALLERKGEPTLLVITKGLKDQLEIGYQARARHLRQEDRQARDALLARRRGQRARARRRHGRAAAGRGRAGAELDARPSPTASRSVAIVLMHAYAYPAHERQAAELARSAGFTQISVSHEVSPLIKIVGRGDTTVADAYLSPILRRHVEKVARALSSSLSPPPPRGEGQG